MNSKPFIVSNEKGLRALPRWLRETGSNSFGYGSRRVISVGYDARPDSDWGRFTKYGSIVVTKEEMFDQVCEVIRKTFGWPADPEANQQNKD